MKKILALTASWCKPCNMIKPVLRKIEEEEGIIIEYLDADKNSDKFSIEGIPTLIYMEDDIEYNRTVGLIRKKTILENYNRGGKVAS